jgi:hypothetical protein
MSAAAADIQSIRTRETGRALRKDSTMTEDRVAKIAEAIPPGETLKMAWTHQGIAPPVGDAYSELMAYLRRRDVTLGASAEATVEPEEAPLEGPPAAPAPRPLLRELHQAYETAQAAERALERQQAHVRQQYKALIAQLKRVHGQIRGARDRGTAHHKLNEVMGLHDHVAELHAQLQRLQHQRDIKALAVLAAAAAYGEGREEARGLLKALRLSQQAAAALPPALAALELDRATQAQTQLAALIGEAEAQAVAAEATRWPAGFLEG